MLEPVQLHWSVITEYRTVVLRCRHPDADSDEPWWHVIEIGPDGRLLRCNMLSPELGLNLNADEQIRDFTFEND